MLEGFSPEEDMNKITELQWKDYAHNDTVTETKLVNTKHGYVIVVKLTWKGGEWVVHTIRNKPRYWVSLDRLIQHVRKVAPKITVVTLLLEESFAYETDSASESETDST
jgi:hypothetical protein